MANEVNIKGAFGAVQSESRYLSSRSDVVAARNKQFDLNSKYTLALRDFNNTSRTDKNYKTKAAAVKAAKAELDSAKREVKRIESLAKSDYRQAKSKVTAEKEKETKGTLNQQILGAQSELQRLQDSGQDTTAQKAKVEDLISKRDKTGKYAPIQTGTTGGTTGTGGTGALIRDYSREITDAAKKIDGMSAQLRTDLQQRLKDAGYYGGPVNGLYSDDLTLAYRKLLQDNAARSKDLGREISYEQFLTDKIIENKTVGGAGGPQVSGAISYSTKLEAASRIENLFRQELGRTPTPQELADFTNKLQKRERKQSAVTKYTTSKKGGMTVTETSGGLDRDQFLTNLIRKMPEYSQRKAESRSLSVQSLQSVANDNGINLSPSQLQQYALDIENGKDINVIQSEIRNLAGIGMPDSVKKLLAGGTDLSTIYSPYRQAMSSVLEVNPQTISLNDPVLRSAIGPNGEVSLYDFQRQLRKDPRWQYTNNAREEVSNIALGVLRDFGFQG